VGSQVHSREQPSFQTQNFALVSPAGPGCLSPHLPLWQGQLRLSERCLASPQTEVVSRCAALGSVPAFPQKWEVHKLKVRGFGSQPSTRASPTCVLVSGHHCLI
jgi:hypothetical protein